MADSISPKDKLDAEIELMKLAWSSFDRRRDFEWKVALGLWTALSAFIGIVLTHDITDNVAIPIGTTAAAVLVSALHYNFNYGLGKANNADRELQYFYEKRILTTLGITWSDKVREGFKALKEHMGVISNFSHTMQVGVTLVLCAGCVGAVWVGYLASTPTVGG